MNAVKVDIIDQLRKDMLLLQGFKKIINPYAPEILPASVRSAFPNAQFPIGAVHEFISFHQEEVAATAGFISGILASIMLKSGACIWINSSKNIFPPALKLFGIPPEKIIFIHLKKEKEILWAMEEALKCESLTAVIGELRELNFTASRRLQLAVEKSQVTGFILRDNPRSLNTTACVTRWKITSLPSELPNDMPGVGFPKWEVELLKVRNGKPGKWEIEFTEGRLRYNSKINAIPMISKKKTG